MQSTLVFPLQQPVDIVNETVETWIFEWIVSRTAPLFNFVYMLVRCKCFFRNDRFLHGVQKPTNLNLFLINLRSFKKKSPQKRAPTKNNFWKWQLKKRFHDSTFGKFSVNEVDTSFTFEMNTLNSVLIWFKKAILEIKLYCKWLIQNS